MHGSLGPLNSMRYPAPYPATTYGRYAKNRSRKIHIRRAAADKVLGEAIFPWPRDRRHLKRPELVLFWSEVSGGFHRIVPRYFLAAVAGFAAEDAGHCAFGDVLGFVKRLAVADAGDQVGV